MSRENVCEKCFTFIWTVENASFFWHKGSEYMDSPLFKVDELEETNWKLRLYEIFGDDKGYIGFWLIRNVDNKSLGSVQLDYELAFLASDGTVLESFKEEAKTVDAIRSGGNCIFASRNDVFFKRKSVFLPEDTLTARCRIWKSVGEFSKEVQCFARTRVVVEKSSLLWKIENFSTLKLGTVQTCNIKSLDTDEQLMCLELLVTGGQILGDTVRLAVTPNYERMKTSSLHLFLVDTSGYLEECSQNEFCYLNSIKRKESDLFFTKGKLMEKKAVYLPKDILSIKCKFSFSSGVLQQEINEFSDCTFDEKNKSDDLCLLKENDLNVHKCILIDNLESMLNNSCFSDVKLKAKSQTYPAHTFILGARSPVFKAMFSSDTKEKINECVDIEDLNDDTVLHLLRYIYCAEVKELEWVSARELYEAADRYEVLNLKDICSSYLKNNLCTSNACEALVLADQHQDEDLKSYVQDFILGHGKEVICSEEWDQFMETNVKLAAETMRRKYTKSY